MTSQFKISNEYVFQKTQTYIGEINIIQSIVGDQSDKYLATVSSILRMDEKTSHVQCDYNRNVHGLDSIAGERIQCLKTML